MGTSLHNKIYLGRTSAFTNRKVQGALALAACVLVALGWLAVRNH
ncbi:hypothetical protein [Zemynaea arenosa]|nr:hypothetical protein [Massilia arenosa]